jgi:hypothetical protein
MSSAYSLQAVRSMLWLSPWTVLLTLRSIYNVQFPCRLRYENVNKCSVFLYRNADILQLLIMLILNGILLLCRHKFRLMLRTSPCLVMYYYYQYIENGKWLFMYTQEVILFSTILTKTYKIFKRVRHLLYSLFLMVMWHCLRKKHIFSSFEQVKYLKETN